jgi:hypothetical protein
MIYRIAEFVVLAALWAFVALGFVIAIAGSIMAFGWWSIAFWAFTVCLLISLNKPDPEVSVW